MSQSSQQHRVTQKIAGPLAAAMNQKSASNFHAMFFLPTRPVNTGFGVVKVVTGDATL